MRQSHMTDPRTIDRSVNAVGFYDKRYREVGGKDFEEAVKRQIAHNISVELFLQGHIEFRERPFRPHAPQEEVLQGTIYIMSEAEAGTFREAIDERLEQLAKAIEWALRHHANNHGKGYIHGITASNIIQKVLEAEKPA